MGEDLEPYNDENLPLDKGVLLNLDDGEGAEELVDWDALHSNVVVAKLTITERPVEKEGKDKSPRLHLNFKPNTHV